MIPFGFQRSCKATLAEYSQSLPRGVRADQWTGRRRKLGSRPWPKEPRQPYNVTEGVGEETDLHYPYC